MTFDEALRVRHWHRPDPADWAQLCRSCNTSWPCSPWRTSSRTVLEWIRDAHTGHPR